MAMDMVLWKMKANFMKTDGAVFKDYVRSTLEAKKKQAEEKRIAEAVRQSQAASASSASAPGVGLIARMLG